jgi:hypothetical protein
MGIGNLTSDESWARARRRLARNLNARIEGRIPGGAPESVVRSIVEQLYRPEISRHIGSIHAELPARIAHYALDPDLPEWFRREKALDPVNTYAVVDVVVSPSTGLVWFEAESLALQESVGSLRRIMGWGSSLWETNRRPVSGPGYALVLPWTGYFHFLLESLPAFIRSLRYSDASAAVVVHEARPAIVDQILRYLGVADERVVSASRPLILGHHVFTGLSPYSGFVEPSDLHLLKASISDRLASSPSGRDNIYVSRRNTPRRGLANEDELERVLSKNGFKIVYAEHMSFEEQIDTFRRARSVVAPHGAGLANLIWCQGPSSVVEIFAHGMHNDCYARLAVSLGFRYRPVSCGPCPSSAGRIDIPAVLEAALADRKDSMG